MRVKPRSLRCQPLRVVWAVPVHPQHLALDALWRSGCLRPQGKRQCCRLDVVSGTQERVGVPVSEFRVVSRLMTERVRTSSPALTTGLGGGVEQPSLVIPDVTGLGWSKVRAIARELAAADPVDGLVEAVVPLLDAP